jgi:hypothetical protein
MNPPSACVIRRSSGSRVAPFVNAHLSEEKRMCAQNSVGRQPLILALIIGLGLSYGYPVFAQRPPATDDPDQAIALELQATGVKLERRRVVIWFEAGRIATADRERWADSISKGLDDIEALTGLSFGTGRLEYYISQKVTVSHARRGTPRVFLDMVGVQRGAAPYLHEAVHHLQYRYFDGTKEQPGQLVHNWILEGYCSYIQDAVAEAFGSRAVRSFAKGGNQRVDAEAAEFLATPIGRRVVEFVGRPGVPPDIRDRENVAPAFYVLGQSFTKYFVDTIGLGTFNEALLPLLIASQSFEREVERRSGQSLDRLRMRWLRNLSAGVAK